MEQLTYNDKQAVTPGGLVGIVMLKSSGKGEDSQWFDYKQNFFDERIRVEWELETMNVVLPKGTAEYLVKKGWARNMNGTEVRAYNRGLGKEAEAPPERK